MKTLVEMLEELSGLEHIGIVVRRYLVEAANDDDDQVARVRTEIANLKRLIDKVEGAINEVQGHLATKLFRDWESLRQLAVVDDIELAILKRHGVWSEVDDTINEIKGSDERDTKLCQIKFTRRYLLGKLMEKGLVHKKMSKAAVTAAMLNAARS